MKFKKLLCLILLCTVFLFAGCATIEYDRIVLEDGTILDAVSVKLDNQKIENAGFNVNDAKEGVKTKMSNYLLQVVNTFKAREDGLSSIEKYAVLNNLTYSVTENNDYIIASIKFKNYNTFKYFYGLHLVEDTDKNEPDKVEEFLINKYVTTGKTIFSTDDAKYITNDFIAYFDNKFSLDDTNLSYVFGTSEDKLYSNANYQYSLNGINFHQWIINDINQEISTYTIVPKPVNWYLLALSLTFVLIVILYVISLFTKKKSNKQLTIKDVENIINENQTN